MRADGGYEVIKKAIGKLEVKHKEHIACYGVGNERRLTGKHETASIDSFQWVMQLCPISKHTSTCIYANLIHYVQHLQDHTSFQSKQYFGELIN